MKEFFLKSEYSILDLFIFSLVLQIYDYYGLIVTFFVWLFYCYFKPTLEKENINE